VADPALAGFSRSGSYLERQVRRFTQLWEINATREIPDVVEVGRRLAEGLPEPLPDTVVHGDYRLGNLMVERMRPDRVQAVLDWEMGAIGDPRADVGYLLATYTEPGGGPSPLGVSPVTALDGFLTRAEIVERYVERSGRDIGPLGWFGACALEGRGLLRGDYGRFTRGVSRRRGHRGGGLRAGRAVDGRERFGAPPERLRPSASSIVQPRFGPRGTCPRDTLARLRSSP
jgi:aminoglycoside phosphotransferase (APT) family kinase protein